MTKRLLLLALFATPAVAADQCEQWQAALGVAQQQTTDANAAALQRMTTMVTEIQRLQARVKEMEESAKKTESKK